MKELLEEMEFLLETGTFVYPTSLLTKIKTALAQQEPWCMKMNGCKTKCEDCPDEPSQEPDYAYPTIEGYEEITGFKVNDTFRMGWAMARTTNALFKQMEKNT
jgi:hypothetical protein